MLGFINSLFDKYTNGSSNVNNIELYKKAFIHSSYGDDNYERMEWLGDKVLGKVVAQYLFDRYENMKEGFLSKLHSRIVRGETLARLNKLLELGQFIETKEEIDEKTLNNVMESFICAVYLDQGEEVTRDFIIGIIETHLDLVNMITNENNYRDMLKKMHKANGWSKPIYKEISVKNIGDNKEYEMALLDINDEIIGKGIHNIRKKAIQKAAKEGLIYYGEIGF